MKPNLSLTIAIPTYNGAAWIGDTLESIFNQSFKAWKIIIADDCSTDQTVKKIKDTFKKFKIPRSCFAIHSFPKNVGYGKNLQRIKKLVKSDLLFLMGQDDLLLPGSLAKTYQAFQNPNVGAVTRPFFWFWDDPQTPVRAVLPYDPKRDSLISIQDSPRETEKIFESVGQLSGLAYRMKYFTADFHPHTFPAHIYPFARITKHHPVVYLKDFTIAVRIRSSQTRFKKSIYRPSPTKTWVNMFQEVYSKPQYKMAKEAGIRQICTHFVGLVQIKNYGTFSDLFSEIYQLATLYPKNLLNPRFYFFSLGTILIPSFLLRWLTDTYKDKILSRLLKKTHEKPQIQS